MLGRHTGHQHFLELLLKVFYSSICHLSHLYQHPVQQFEHRILLVACHHSFLASFTSICTLDMTDLTSLPELLCGLINSIAVCIPHSTVNSVHVRNRQSYVHLRFRHCCKDRVDVRGIYLINICQHLPGGLDPLMEAVKIPSFKMFKAIIHLSQHLT